MEQTYDLERIYTKSTNNENQYSFYWLGGVIWHSTLIDSYSSWSLFVWGIYAQVVNSVPRDINPKLLEFICGCVNKGYIINTGSVEVQMIVMLQCEPTFTKVYNL